MATDLRLRARFGQPLQRPPTTSATVFFLHQTLLESRALLAVRTVTLWLLLLSASNSEGMRSIDSLNLTCSNTTVICKGAIHNVELTVDLLWFVSRKIRVSLNQHNSYRLEMVGDLTYILHRPLGYILPKFRTLHSK